MVKYRQDTSRKRSEWVVEESEWKEREGAAFGIRTRTRTRTGETCHLRLIDVRIRGQDRTRKDDGKEEERKRINCCPSDN